MELKYRPNTDIVLRKLSFDVEPGCKIGVVGRTGAGKSTLSLALMRIVELVGGRIEIDGVDISQLDLNYLRGQITMIPQDPVMFTGTLRYNLDPFNENRDERIIELLKIAGLEYLLQGLSKKDTAGKDTSEVDKDKSSGLDDFKVQEQGSNLSLGER